MVQIEAEYNADPQLFRDSMPVQKREGCHKGLTAKYVTEIIRNVPLVQGI
jgi:hypothetical protein